MPPLGPSICRTVAELDALSIGDVIFTKELGPALIFQRVLGDKGTGAWASPGVTVLLDSAELLLYFAVKGKRPQFLVIVEGKRK